MKKWSIVVALLYGVTLLVMMIPLIFAAFAPKAAKVTQLAEALGQWQLWVIVALMVLAQFALLRVPVAVAKGKPVAQRSVWITATAAAFMMALLLMGGIVSLHELLTRLQDSTGLLVASSCGLISWLFWAIYFHRTVSKGHSTATLQKYLWRGSILELLVAVPTHIVARHRDYCCAGMMTFVGLTCGVAVMLFAFGPALYSLFVERWRRLHPQSV